TVRAVKRAHPVYETPITIDRDAPVAQVLSVMGKRAHRAAVVIEQGRPVGVITEEDCAEVDRFAQVRDIMHEPEVVVPEGTDVREAFDLLDSQHITLAPVVSGDQLAGVVTRT